MKSSVTLVQDCIDIVPVERVDVVLGRYDDVLCNELRLDEAQIIEYMFYKRRQAIAPEAELRRGSSTSIRYGKPFGLPSAACCEHSVGRLPRLPISTRLGWPGDLVDVREPQDPSRSAPPAVRRLASEDAHAQLRMRPAAPLCLGYGLGHRCGHCGTTRVVVLAFGNLTDEPV